MAIGSGMSCVKYLMFIFNFLFAVTGIVIVIAASVGLAKAAPYADVTKDATSAGAAITLIVIGIVVFVVSFFGFCGAAKENHCMIITFSVTLLIIFLVELAVGITVLLKYPNVKTAIVQNLNDSMTEYPTDKNIAKTFDVIQTDFHCCGINGPADWPARNLPIPSACCSAQILDKGVPAPCTMNSELLHKDGCLAQMTPYLEKALKIIGGVSIGILVFQFLGVVAACLLARSIRNQYETV